jgi:thioredoxin reductase
MSPTAKTAGKLVSSICGDRLVSLEGESDLERVTWLDQSSGERMTRDIRHVFVMAGASPRSDWLRGCVVLDQQGFILTGRDLGQLCFFLSQMADPASIMICII